MLGGQRSASKTPVYPRLCLLTQHVPVPNQRHNPPLASRTGASYIAAQGSISPTQQVQEALPLHCRPATERAPQAGLCPKPALRPQYIEKAHKHIYPQGLPAPPHGRMQCTHLQMAGRASSSGAGQQSTAGHVPPTAAASRCAAKRLPKCRSMAAVQAREACGCVAAGKHLSGPHCTRCVGVAAAPPRWPAPPAPLQTGGSSSTPEAVGGS